jgi:serine/threonine protein kinase
MNDPLFPREPASRLEPAERSTAQSAAQEGTDEDPERTTSYRQSAQRNIAVAGPASRLPCLGGFEVLSVLGGGGMGVVYLARQPRLGRLVALKTLPPALADNPELLERFRNEARVAAGLKGAGVVPVFDILEGPDGPVIVMPYIEGSDLGRLLEDRKAVQDGQPAAGRHPCPGGPRVPRPHPARARQTRGRPDPSRTGPGDSP